MKRKTNLVHSELLERLKYYPKTGLFIWTASLKNKPNLMNTIAGTSLGEGKQTAIQIRNEHWMASHLAYYYMTGEIHQGRILHKNGNLADNSFNNLVAMLCENGGVRGLVRSSSGYKVRRNGQYLGWAKTIEGGKAILRKADLQY